MYAARLCSEDIEAAASWIATYVPPEAGPVSPVDEAGTAVTGVPVKRPRIGKYLPELPAKRLPSNRKDRRDGCRHDSKLVTG